MNEITFAILIVSLVCTVAAIGLWFIFKSTSKIFDKLHVLKEKASAANNKESLLLVYDELVNVNKECWHRSFSSLVIEIKTIIDVKLEFIKKNTNNLSGYGVIYNGIVFRFNDVDGNGRMICKDAISVEDLNTLNLSGNIVDYEVNDDGGKNYKKF